MSLINIIHYSDLNAITGSFLEAILDGINPPISVNTVLIIIKINALTKGSTADTDTPVIFFIPIFIPIFNMQVIIVHNTPENNPIINVSALNTLDMSFFYAPIALNIPISLVRSNTLI